MKTEVTEFLASGQLARLIPTVADSKKEERATSSLLASFMVVPVFAREVFSSAGAPVGKRLKITCYTEVTFKTNDKEKRPRPDGLVVIHNGSKIWTALIESKIGNAELTNEQVEEYLDIAKQLGINAVITISNQFATTPTHHPLTINKNKTRSVELYHFSWLSLKSKAVLLMGNKAVDDPEQAYILSELVRYLDHDSSGVSSLTKMSSEWKDICNSIQQGTNLSKNSELVKSSVSDWHQLLRHLSLNLSMRIAEPVDIALSRAREKDSELNFAEDCDYLSKENKLIAEFTIPNAASKLAFSADFLRRTINISMKLEAPKDKSRATASINWVTRQLKGENIENVSVRAYWPKRIKMTAASLSEATADPTVEIIRVIDLAAKFKGSKTFVEESSKGFPKFYQDVGQQLSQWVAKAPKIKESEQAAPSIPTIFTEPNKFVVEENINNEATSQPKSVELSSEE